MSFDTIEFFANKLWAKKTGPIYRPEVVMCIGYSLANERLSRGATSAFQRAIRVARRFPSTKVLFGAFAHSQNLPLEKSLKENLLAEVGIAPERIIYLGPVSSTLTEAEDAKRELETRDIVPSEIVIATGACHSRTCYFVWRRVFPQAVIRMEVFDLDHEIDREDAMKFLRSSWKWLGINIARHIVFRMLYFVGGLRFLKATMGRVRQPTAKLA